MNDLNELKLEGPDHKTIQLDTNISDTNISIKEDDIQKELNKIKNLVTPSPASSADSKRSLFTFITLYSDNWDIKVYASEETDTSPDESTEETYTSSDESTEKADTPSDG